MAGTPRSTGPDRSAGALCVSPASSLLGNAYYCRGDDGIVYDSAALVPVLLDLYGPAGTDRVAGP